MSEIVVVVYDGDVVITGAPKKGVTVKVLIPDKNECYFDTGGVGFRDTIKNEDVDKYFDGYYDCKTCDWEGFGYALDKEEVIVDACNGWEKIKCCPDCGSPDIKRRT